MDGRPRSAMKWTAWIFLGVFVAAAIYDGVIVYTCGVDASISRFMQNAGHDSPFIVLVCGYLAGHFWGFVKPDKTAVEPDAATPRMTKVATTTTVALIAAVLYDAITVFNYGESYALSRFMKNAGFDSPFVTLVCGYLAGHFLGYMKPNNFRCNGKH